MSSNTQRAPSCSPSPSPTFTPSFCNICTWPVVPKTNGLKRTKNNKNHSSNFQTKTIFQSTSQKKDTAKDMTFSLNTGPASFQMKKMEKLPVPTSERTWEDRDPR